MKWRNFTLPRINKIKIISFIIIFYVNIRLVAVLAHNFLDGTVHNIVHFLRSKVETFGMNKWQTYEFFIATAVVCALCRKRKVVYNGISVCSLTDRLYCRVFSSPFCFGVSPNECQINVYIQSEFRLSLCRAYLRKMKGNNKSTDRPTDANHPFYTNEHSFFDVTGAAAADEQIQPQQVEKKINLKLNWTFKIIGFRFGISIFFFLFFFFYFAKHESDNVYLNANDHRRSANGYLFCTSCELTQPK